MLRFRGDFVLCCLVGLLLASGGAHAAESNTVSKADARESIKKAMEAEMSGDFESRDKWIGEAMKYKADALAHSQKGLLKAKGSEWLNIDDAAAKIADSTAMKRYEAIRADFFDSVEGNWNLAQACKKANLPDQAMAHLHRVIELDPDHAQARAALGFQAGNGEWIAPEQIEQEFLIGKALSVAAEKHGRLLRELAPQLVSTQAWERQRAQDRLLASRDSSLALAAEQILSPINEEMEQFVIGYLGGIDDPATTYLLTRKAISHPSPRIREAAAKELADRDLHAYAPRLLALLSMPIRSEVEAIVTAKGDVIGYQQVFERVGMDRNHILGRENATIPKSDKQSSFLTSLTQPQLVRQRARDQDEAQQIAKASLSPTSVAHQQLAAQLNAQIALRNEHVFRILRLATRQDLPSDPQQWWKWYEEQIGVEVKGRGYQETEQLRQRMVDSGYNKLVPPRPPYVPGRCDCFVAGTLVTTHRGAVAIETIRIGDLVLSKDIDSGALAFRPVLKRTVRDPEELVELRTDKDVLRCTPGHHFWVSGKGWIKAGELKQGMILHGAEQPARLNEILEVGEIATYNLHVADNANYFVGQGRILSHDASSLGPASVTIPGYQSTLRR